VTYRATYTIATPKKSRENISGVFRKNLRIRISDQWKEKGYRSCEDIVKISVTSQLIFFDSLELPIIGELARANMADRISQEVMAQGRPRLQ
jgi:hypothetical protein